MEDYDSNNGKDAHVSHTFFLPLFEAKNLGISEPKFGHKGLKLRISSLILAHT